MTLSERLTLVCALAFTLLITAGCGGGHDGCRPNTAVTADMAALNLPAPDGAKLCHAEPKFVMYEIEKDRAAVLQESTAKIEGAGWKQIPNPASGASDDSSSLFYQKNGRQVMYRVAKCSRSSFADLSSSCSIVTFDDVTK